MRHHIENGASFEEGASSILTRGEGNRVTLERALLAAAGISSRPWLVRPQGSAILNGPLPDLEAWTRRFWPSMEYRA